MFHKASPPRKTDQLKHDATFPPKPFDAEDTVSRIALKLGKDIHSIVLVSIHISAHLIVDRVDSSNCTTGNIPPCRAVAFINYPHRETFWLILAIGSVESEKDDTARIWTATVHPPDESFISCKLGIEPAKHIRLVLPFTTRSNITTAQSGPVVDLSCQLTLPGRVACLVSIHFPADLRLSICGAHVRASIAAEISSPFLTGSKTNHGLSIS